MSKFRFLVTWKISELWPAYYGMQCILWYALHSDNRPLCRCKKNFTNYDKYETSKVANLQHFSIIRCIWCINEQKIKV